MEAECKRKSLFGFLLVKKKEESFSSSSQSHHIDLFDTIVYDPGPNFPILSYPINHQAGSMKQEWNQMPSYVILGFFRITFFFMKGNNYSYTKYI